MARLLAAGGIVGPTAFVASWAALGATREGYRPAYDAISRLAEEGAATRPFMTAGFVAFGVGVPLFGAALCRACPGPAWTAAVATGVATLGVAAFPLDAGPDTAHAVAAGIGYATLAALPLLAAPTMRGRDRWLSVAAGTVSALALAATTVSSTSGLWQRVGLTAGDVWIVATAWRIVTGTMPPCSSGWTSR
ncbi:MAG TPA: DUF998 domain-containing protein [Acidimicrobiales bacterium]|nr:DUF998 domain-containing protein [Acidimicrobiales bacterium]